MAAKKQNLGFVFTLLFAYLIGLSFSSPRSFLGIYGQIWIFSGGAYFSAVLLYHFYRKDFPYLGQRRVLVFPELAYLAVLFFVCPHENIIWLLLFIQTTALVVSQNLSPSPGKYFLSLYLLIVWLICSFAVHYQDELSWFFSALSGFVPSLGILLWVCFLHYTLGVLRKKEEDSLEEKSWEQIENKVQTWYAEKKLQKVEEKQDSLIKKEKSNYTKVLKGKKEKYKQNIQHYQVFLGMYKKWYNSETKITLSLKERLSDIESILFSSIHPKNLEKKYHKELNLAEEVEQHLLWAREAKENSSPEFQTEVLVHFLEGTPEKIKTSLYPLVSWTIHQWLSYFFQNQASNIKVFLSYHNKQLHLKGVANWALQEQELHMEGIKCKTCSNTVRQLYKNPTNETEGCSQCMKSVLEQQLKDDWERGLQGELENNPELALARHTFRSYDLGNIHYGVTSWDQREYFVTLILQDGL